MTSADVVLMDVRMPELDGVATTEHLLARPGAPKVIVLTTFDLDEYVFAAIRAGASGFLLKDARPEELLGAIRSVARRRRRRRAERHAPPARARRDDAAARPSTTRGSTPHAARARGAGGGRQGPLERRDRRRPLHGRGDGQDPRRAAVEQARAARPRPAGRSSPTSDRPLGWYRSWRSYTGRDRGWMEDGRRAPHPAWHDRNTHPPALVAWAGYAAAALGDRATRSASASTKASAARLGIAGTYADPEAMRRASLLAGALIFAVGVGALAFVRPWGLRLPRWLVIVPALVGSAYSMAHALTAYVTKPLDALGVVAARVPRLGGAPRDRAVPLGPAVLRALVPRPRPARHRRRAAPLPAHRRDAPAAADRRHRGDDRGADRRGLRARRQSLVVQTSKAPSGGSVPGT